MSIASSSWHGGTRLGDNGHNVAAGCQGWDRDPGKEITSKASNTRTATITPYPVLSLFYMSNWLNITCIFFDYLIWHNSISCVNYYDFAVKLFLTYLCISKSGANEFIATLRFLFWTFVNLVHPLSLDSKQHRILSPVKSLLLMNHKSDSFYLCLRNCECI